MKNFDKNTFNTTISAIRSAGKKFDGNVQSAIMACVAHVIEHKDASPMENLLDAMGKSSRKAQAIAYFKHLLSAEKGSDGKAHCFVTITKNSEKLGGFDVKFNAVKGKGKTELTEKYTSEVVSLFGTRVLACQWADFEKEKKATAEKTDLEKAQTSLKTYGKNLKNAVTFMTSEEKENMRASLRELMAELAEVEYAQAA